MGTLSNNIINHSLLFWTVYVLIKKDSISTNTFHIKLQRYIKK